MLPELSCVTRKPAYGICENKGSGQLRGRIADKLHCFRNIDGTTSLLPKSEISSLLAFSVAVEAGVFRTWSEPLRTGFLLTRLNLYKGQNKGYHCKTRFHQYIKQAAQRAAIAHLRASKSSKYFE